LSDLSRASGTVIIPPTVPTLLVPNGTRPRFFAIRWDTTVIVAPVSKPKLALNSPFNTTGTMTDVPFIITGTVIGPEPSVGDDGTTIDAGNEISAGKDLKNFSSFLDSAVSLFLIQPTAPFLAFTRYHRELSLTKVSAKGEISSPLFRIATTAEDSSGAVKSLMSLLDGGGVNVVGACEKVLQTVRTVKVATTRAALNFVETPPKKDKF
jgi:hypothetical protein